MNIAEVVNKHYCLGCGLCVADVGTDKLKMIETVGGFLVPAVQNGFNGEVKSLQQYCPGIRVIMETKLRTSNDKIYGPVSEVKVAYATDPIIRFRGASGGCITAILCSLLDQGRIEGVLHVGACPEAPAETKDCFSKSAEEIIYNAGSRYAPASVLVNFKKIIEKNSRIAVVGKPCDIVGVKQYLKLHPEYADKVYCTYSFMCMGLPSQHATNRLIKQLGVQDTKCVKTLIYRGRGWPGKTFVTTESNEVFSCSYENSWGNILGRDILFRCKICPDGWGGFADLSAGDAWFSDGQNPLFDEKPGRSFLFIRTARGREVIETCAAAISCDDYYIKELPVIQRSQHHRKNRVWIRYILLKLFGDRVLKFKGLGMFSYTYKSIPVGIIRECYGFIRRIPKSKGSLQPDVNHDYNVP